MYTIVLIAAMFGNSAQVLSQASPQFFTREACQWTVDRLNQASSLQHQCILVKS